MTTFRLLPMLLTQLASLQNLERLAQGLRACVDDTLTLEGDFLFPLSVVVIPWQMTVFSRPLGWLGHGEAENRAHLYGRPF
jgi:hypothetical protein